MSSRWSFLLPWHPSKRFSLATLLIFTTVVAVAFALPRLMVAVVATVPFLLVGGAAIACGWRVKRHQLAVRLLAVGLGAAMLAAGVWVFSVLLPS